MLQVCRSQWLKVIYVCSSFIRSKLFQKGKRLLDKDTLLCCCLKLAFEATAHCCSLIFCSNTVLTSKRKHTREMMEFRSVVTNTGDPKQTWQRHKRCQKVLTIINEWIVFMLRRAKENLQRKIQHRDESCERRITGRTDARWGAAPPDKISCSAAFKYNTFQANGLFKLKTVEVSEPSAGTTVGCMKLASDAARFKQCKNQFDCDHIDEESTERHKISAAPQLYY